MKGYKAKDRLLSKTILCATVSTWLLDQLYTNKYPVPVIVHTLKTCDRALSKIIKKPVSQGCVPTVISETVDQGEFLQRMQLTNVG